MHWLFVWNRFERGVVLSNCWLRSISKFLAIEFEMIVQFKLYRAKRSMFRLRSSTRSTLLFVVSSHTRCLHLFAVFIFLQINQLLLGNYLWKQSTCKCVWVCVFFFLLKKKASLIKSNVIKMYCFECDAWTSLWSDNITIDFISVLTFCCLTTALASITSIVWSTQYIVQLIVSFILEWFWSKKVH